MNKKIERQAARVQALLDSYRGVVRENPDDETERRGAFSALYKEFEALRELELAPLKQR